MALCITVLAGCTLHPPQIVTLKDGTVYHARKQPEYDKSTGFYLFDTIGGHHLEVNRDQVKSIKTEPGQ